MAPFHFVASIRGLFIIALVGWSFFSGERSAASETTNTPVKKVPTPGNTIVMTNEAQAAALRGVDWLVANKDRMTLSFALKTFEKIHRVTASEPLRQRMAILIQEKCQALPTNTPSLDLTTPNKYDWYEIRPVVMDLIFLKSQGKPWKAEADKLGKLFTQRGDAILPSRSTLSERLVAAYKLQILGLPTGEIYTNTLAAIRAQGPAVWATDQKPDMAVLYARTHVVFTASGYYSRYLSPTEFASELECFASALAHFSNWKEMDADWADIASEVLIARKILHQKPNPDSLALSHRLVTMQNKDGSWGWPTFSNTKVHNTYMAIIALIEFAEEFQINVDYL